MRVATLQYDSQQGRVRRIVILLALLWTVSMADLGLTLWAARFSAFRELNPVAASFLASHQLFGVIAWKISLMLVATLTFWLARKRLSTELALWGLIAVFMLLAVRWSQFTRDAMAQTQGAPTDQVASAPAD
jgi:hypothetical protein